MKLSFTKTEEGSIIADFQGNPVEATKAVVHSMAQHELVAKIIMTAAITYQEHQNILNDEVESVEIHEKRTN